MEASPAVDSETANATGGSGGTLDVEVLRDRVRLYLKVMFLIDLGIYAMTGILRLAGWEPPQLHEQPGLTLAIRWSITALLVGGWLYAARGRPNRTVLIGMESIGTLVIAWLYVHLARAVPVHGSMFALLMVSLALTLRASVVPSPVGRTLMVGGLAVATTAVTAHKTAVALPDMAVAWLATMGTAFIVVTTVTSYVIYGLRREVRAAKRLGQYELGRKIGEGGMGSVYEATHVLLRRPTALKLLPIDKVGEKTVARFEREVKQTSRLEHPNSIYVYDYGRTPDGQFYYAMEYLDGFALDDLVEAHGPLEQARVVSILEQAARALAEAHAMGLVHRDIKPANIMLCERGLVPDMVKVLDFGLVKELEAGDGTVTQANTILGTPLYMAPEAITAPDEVGPGVDVYALGAVAYFLLTGVEPFRAKTLIEVCSKHLTEQPVAPSKVSEQAIDPALDRLIMRCLEKSPADRFADGAALAEALGALELPGWRKTDAARWWNENRTRTSEVVRETRPANQLTVDVMVRTD